LREANPIEPVAPSKAIFFLFIRVQYKNRGSPDQRNAATP
jgi:hypothetical protein